MDPFADRLYHCLLDALRDRGSAQDGRPVTVAEIYQELVPYRTVRERVGVDLNADYEHALLRLLAGEDDRLRLEPAAAQEELRRELGSTNPYVGIYRKFAACDVWVKIPEAADEKGAQGTRAAGADTGDDAVVSARPIPVPAGVVPSAEPAPRYAPPARPAAPSPAPAPAPALAAAPAGGESSCSFCREVLPGGRNVRFCPNCGRDQRLRPCAGCGEALDRAWRYCIACGVPVQLTAHPGKVPG